MLTVFSQNRWQFVFILIDSKVRSWIVTEVSSLRLEAEDQDEVDEVACRGTEWQESSNRYFDCLKTNQATTLQLIFLKTVQLYSQTFVVSLISLSTNNLYVSIILYIVLFCNYYYGNTILIFLSIRLLQFVSFVWFKLLQIKLQSFFY